MPPSGIFPYDWHVAPFNSGDGPRHSNVKQLLCTRFTRTLDGKVENAGIVVLDVSPLKSNSRAEEGACGWYGRQLAPVQYESI